MKLSARRFVWLELLKSAFEAAGKAAVMPLLQNVHLAAVSPMQVEVVGSDGEVTVRLESIQVEVEAGGACLLPPRVLAMVSACPEELITLSVEEGVLTLQCGAYSAAVPLEVDAYPATDFRSWLPQYDLPREALEVALRHCRPPVIGPAVRPQHAYVCVRDGRMTGYDGSRLHQAAVSGWPVDLLLPTRAVVELGKRLGSVAAEVVRAAVSDQGYAFWLDDLLLVVTRPTTVYPDVERQMVAPAASNGQVVELDRTLFESSVRRVMLTTDSDTSYLSVELGDDRMLLAAVDRFGNASREQLTVGWTYPPRQLGVNGRYLLDLLGALTAPRIALALRAEGAPQLLRFEESGFLGILVQLRPDFGPAVRSELPGTTAVAGRSGSGRR